MKSNIEIGKVVFIVYGPSSEKIGVIIDILDKKRCLIDGPCGRQIINIKRIELTTLRLDLKNKSTSKDIKQKFVQNNVLKNWCHTSKGKNLLKKISKRNLSNFDHFKFMIGKKHLSRLLYLGKISK